MDTIILRFQKRISLKDKKFVLNAVFRFIRLEKANLFYYRGSKRNIDILYKNKTAKLKQSKSETVSAEEVRPIARSILIQTPKFNIFANLNNAMKSNYIAAKAISPSLDLTTDMCLAICKNKNRLHLVMLKILCIFMDVYDKSQANNMFY